MKKLLLFLLCISCARQMPPEYVAPPILASVSLVDRNGMTETISQSDRLKQFEHVDFSSPQPYQKVLCVYARTPKGEIQARVTSYHPNGQPKQYLEIVNNRAFGAYREWHTDGTLKLEATVIGGGADLSSAAESTWLFDGCSQVWDENGKLLAKIDYVKGELHGHSLYYHANGTLWKRVPFNKNQMHGTFEIFLEDGSLLQTAEYVQGLKNGTSIRYWADGKVAAQEDYKMGLLDQGQCFSISGEPVSSIVDGNGFRAVFGRDFVCELHEYQKGLEEGQVKFFDRAGTLVQSHFLKDGVKHGAEIEFVSNKPKLSVNWVEGKLQGIMKTWYDNGVQESQREMSHNMKNGLLTAWYEDGSLMMIEEYEQDTLVKGKYFKKGDKTPTSEVSAGEGIVTLFDSKGNFNQKVTYHCSKPQD